MFKFLNKGISTPVAMGIILILAISIGGFTWWQYLEVEKEKTNVSEVQIPEKEEVEDETANWNTYEGKIEGTSNTYFSLKYPNNWQIETILSENQEYTRKVLHTIDSLGNEYRISLGWGGHGVDGTLMGQGETEIPHKKEDVIYNNYKAIKDFTFRKSTNGLVYILIVFAEYQGAIFEMGLLNIPNDQQNQDIIRQIDKILNTIKFSE